MSQVLYCRSGAEYLLQATIPGTGTNTGTVFLMVQTGSYGTEGNNSQTYWYLTPVPTGSNTTSPTLFHVRNQGASPQNNDYLYANSPLNVTTYYNIDATSPSPGVYALNSGEFVFLESLSSASPFVLVPTVDAGNDASNSVLPLSIGQSYYLTVGSSYVTMVYQFFGANGVGFNAYVFTTSGADSTNAITVQLFPTTPYFQYCSDELTNVYGSPATLGYPLDGSIWNCTSLPTGGSMCMGPAGSALIMAGQGAACQGSSTSSLAINALRSKYGSDFWRRSKNAKIKNDYARGLTANVLNNVALVLGIALAAAAIVGLFYLLAMLIPKKSLGIEQ